MRRFVLLVASACAFDPRAESPDANPDKGGTPGKPEQAVCHVSDDALQLCLDFEDPSLEPVTLDGSPSHANATTQFVSAMTRGTEQAMHLSSRAAVFAPTVGVARPMTFEMFVNPDGKPQHDEYLAATLAYGLFHDSDGSLAVTYGGNTAWTSDDILSIGQWTHVGFVADRDLRLYVDGDVAACTDLSQTLLTSGGTFLIGDSSDGTHGFVGGVDDVHIYSRALTADEMCERAGRSHCKQNCPE